MPRERESDTDKVRPAHELRLGRIKAAVWANQTENGLRHNVTFSRLYKDEHNDWQDSGSFGRDDLLVLAKLADQAHTWICEQGANNGRTKTDKPSEQPQEDVHF